VKKGIKRPLKKSEFESNRGIQRGDNEQEIHGSYTAITARSFPKTLMRKRNGQRGNAKGIKGPKY
jgi:hypothetical protein